MEGGGVRAGFSRITACGWLALALAGCLSSDRDPSAAQSMISGYRRNNGLGPVTIDPMLTRMAQEQARIMAERDKLDHSAGRPFQERINTSGFNAKVAAENISAGYHT